MTWNLRHGLFRATLTTLASARFPDWAPAVGGVRGSVLTLHHVRPEQRQPFDPNSHLSITPDFLEALILGLKQSGHRFVGLDDILSSGTEAGAGRRIAFTLDDGFRDNLEHAWPVFARHSVPFTIYVCAGFCDRTTEIWWEALERIVRSATHVQLDSDKRSPSLPAGTLEEKRRAFAIWVKWLRTEVDEHGQRAAVRKLADQYGLDLRKMADELIMDWDEVRRIAADPLCSIGAHTLTHPALARLPADEALREMRESADRIEIEIGRRPSTIAFPYGFESAAAEREFSLAEEAGFAASVTTRPGVVGAATRRHGLRRVSVNGNYQSVRLIRVLATPALWWLRDRFSAES